MFNDLSVKRESLPANIPVFPLTGVLLLPGIELPLNIFEPRYINMIDDALAEKKMLGIIQPDQKLFSRSAKNKPLYKTGCLGKIKAFNETEDGRYLIVLSGITRFHIDEEIATIRGYRRFKVDYHEFESDFDIKTMRSDYKLEVDIKELIRKVDEYLRETDTNSGLHDLGALANVEDGFLIDFLCSYLPFKPAEKQLFLEAKTVEERAKCIYKVLGVSDNQPKLIDLGKTIH